MAKLTKATVLKLKAPTGERDDAGNPKPRIHWDSGHPDAVPGFGVLCSGRTATRTFIAQGKVRGRTRRVTIGRVSAWFADERGVEDARREAGRIVQDLREGRDPKARGVATLRGALDAYLEENVDLSERTRTYYRTLLERWFEPWLDRKLRDITPDELGKRYRWIQREIARRAAKKDRERPDLFVSEPGAATANSALRALRSVWRFAARKDRDGVPAWVPPESWYHVGRRERHVRLEDLATFYGVVNARGEDGEYVHGRLVRDYALLLLFTGMRREEAASLTWSDVDFGDDVIRASAFKVKGKRKPLHLPMSRLVRDLLRERRDIGFESEFVFPSDGQRGHLVEPKKAFMRISRAAGFPVNPHSVRSTFATVAAGVVTPYEVKGLVNHSPGGAADVTAGYVQLTTESLRKPAEAVGRRLAELCGMQRSKRGRAKKSGKRARSAK